MGSFERGGEVEATEAELRHALRHVAAPAGFTERVMQRAAARSADAHRVQATTGRRGLHFFSNAHRAGWLTAVAAMLLLTVGGGDLLHLRHERQMREAAAAEARVDLAMQLTGRALAQVETGLNRSPAGRFTQMLNETHK